MTTAARTHPGDVNAHTHVYSGLAPLGMPAPMPAPGTFPEILRRVWWRLDRALDARALRAAARYYVAHALLSGTTVIVDHHESPSFIEGSLDVIADACQELGMRAVLCYGTTERNGGRDEARRGLEECRRFVESNRRSLVRGAVGLHASFTVSDETISDAAALARALDTIVHVHVAEDASDVIDAIARGYEGPLERLSHLGALPAGSVLAHGVCLDPDQVRRAAASSCWIVQNPRSNRQNGVGYPWALSASPRVALGTDGFPSDMDVERAALRRDAERAGEDPEVAVQRGERGAVFAADVWCSCGGAAADLLGTVERGAGAGVRVIAGDRLLVENGRLVTADIDAIDADAREAAALLWPRLAAIS